MIGRKLRAKKVNEGIEMPRYAHEGDAGLDLRITETVTLEPMQKCVVGCGLAVEIPSGCVGLETRAAALPQSRASRFRTVLALSTAAIAARSARLSSTRATRRLRSKRARAYANLS